MRIAAGILMLIVGTAWLGLNAIVLRWSYGDVGVLSFYLSFSIAAVFLVIGGALSLKGRYWRLCFYSALLPVIIMIPLALLWGRPPAWYFIYLWFLIPPGILAIIFIGLRRRQWPEAHG